MDDGQVKPSDGGLVKGRREVQTVANTGGQTSRRGARTVRSRHPIQLAQLAQLAQRWKHEQVEQLD